MAKENPLDANLPPEFAEGWRPNPGDSVEGIVVDVDKGWSEFAKDFYPIVTIRRDNGQEVAVHAFHSVLKNELVRKRPKNEEHIRIVYVGAKENKTPGMSPTEIYSVTTESGFKEDVWDAFGTTARGVRRPSNEEPPF